MRFACCALACLFELGCGSPADGVSRAADWTAPYLVQFAKFDRWARRASASDAVLQSRAALGETTFAPIRRDEAIAAAWVRLDGEHPFTLALPAATELPMLATWIALRDPSLGALRAARLADCARLVPASKTRDAGACVLISRTEATPPNGATTVTVAFRQH